jgi:putative redox protein
MTIMGIKARDNGIDIKGTEIEVTKIMASDPRRLPKWWLSSIFRRKITPMRKSNLLKVLQESARCH